MYLDPCLIFVCVRACVRACMRACVHACVRARVRMCVCYVRQHSQVVRVLGMVAALILGYAKLVLLSNKLYSHCFSIPAV